MEEINFESYINLFNYGRSIKDMEPIDDQTYKVLRSSNLDIRVFDREECFRPLSKTKKLDRFTVDTKYGSHRFFYTIPVQTPSGDYVGFIYRTVFTKAYASVYRPFKNRENKVPYMFGFFRDFQSYNRHTSQMKTCMPIIVCEGAKDAIILKSFYPYVVSNNTSSMGLNNYVISNITDKVLLAYDNDETGHMSTKKDKKILSGLGCSVDSITIKDGYKDIADYVNHPTDMAALKKQISSRIKGLIYGVTLAV